MNILVPVTWLEEYLETKMSPEELAALGSLHGPSFERLENIDGEPVFDIEITTNRVDSMSIKGLARELAAIAGTRVKTKKLDKPVQISWSLQTTPLPLPKVSVQTPSVKRIVCVVLDQVKNQDSPAWMQKRLHQIGQNSHGIIIDMSNYVTHELGHPCHTFDYDKIMSLGGEIIVKQAAAGKKFVTLDGEQHQTLGGEVVFENKAGEIIDLPAIKGTANTAISPTTKRVLFWLENMDAPTVRQASMNHAIRTVAAILNEKNVDPMLMDEVLALGVEILQKQAGALIASPVYSYQDESLKKPIQAIKFDLDRLDRYLGVAIKPERVREILVSLGFVVTPTTARQWQVTPPTFRAHDVTMEADLIEEVARIYGYHRLPSNLDFPVVQIPRQERFDFTLERELKHALVASGLTEVYTYSMISEAQVAGNPDTWLKLLNPLTEDKVYLRQSLIPSLQQVYEHNQIDNREVAGIFELANVYFPGDTDDQVNECLRLAWITTLPYRQARALLERTLRLAHEQINIDDKGKITTGGHLLGTIQTLTGFRIAVELDLDAVVAACRPLEVKGHLPVGVPVHEDLTFVLPEGANVGPLIAALEAVSPLVARVSLGDIYRDHYTFHLTYQANEGNIDNETLRLLRQEIVGTAQKLGSELVGSLESTHG
ncbi:phenylalanine--tRNA ligase subunit beta [bacterium]|nr:phenylalanine--tRNA ligase subunit beta [bacterium]